MYELQWQYIDRNHVERITKNKTGGVCMICPRGAYLGREQMQQMGEYFRKCFVIQASGVVVFSIVMLCVLIIRRIVKEVYTQNLSWLTPIRNV